ncbi:MAG: type 4a pilus biogenesis protein PilO [Desulfovermiculus sp.]|nr:type 4a pilus biogenesis protein PilO [Desulfovermiculus sp.]
MAEQSLRSRWTDLSLARKALYSCLAGLGLAGALWFFLFKPQMDEIASMQQDITRLDKDIAQYRIQIKALPQVQEDVKARKRELAYAQTLLPETNSDAENLLSSIEKLGNDVGIEFLLFTPGQEKKHDFYASRTINVRFQGSFHNLMRFFDHLSGLDRLVTLESVQLRPTSSSRIEDVSLQADCQLRIYRMLSEQERGSKGSKS